MFHSFGRVSEVKDILMQRGTKFQFADTNVKRSYNEDDIIKSVKKLSKLGSGFRTITVGQVVLIVSVPEELDNDHMQIMNLAEDDRYGQYGEVTIDNISRALRWNEERSNRALELLLGKGMLWLDVNRGEKSYWFPR
jgi:ESCRT-II complex subunit VPS22